MDIQAHLSARFDTLQKSVDRAAKLAEEAQAYQMEQSRAVKAIRLPVLQAVGANPFSIGGDTGGGSTGSPLIVGPEQGFVWSLRHVAIEGLTAGATPDVLNLRRSSATGRLVWQFDGSRAGTAQSWSRGSVIFYAGETMFWQSVGTFASTAQIVISGLAEQVPGEKIAIFF